MIPPRVRARFTARTVPRTQPACNARSAPVPRDAGTVRWHPCHPASSARYRGLDLHRHVDLELLGQLPLLVLQLRDLCSWQQHRGEAAGSLGEALVRDEDHKDVHPALPWSACTIRAGTRGLAVCGWAAESPIIALRKMPEALCVASLRHVVVCRVQRPPLVCSAFWHNNRLTGSIPSQLSSLSQLTFLCVRPCLIPLRPRCHAGALFVVALHRSLVCDIRHKLTAAAGVQRIT